MHLIGETANTIQPPEQSCGSQEPGRLCNEKTCFACNSVREANAQTVRGTLLVSKIQSYITLWKHKTHIPPRFFTNICIVMCTDTL